MNREFLLVRADQQTDDLSAGQTGKASVSAEIDGISEGG